MERIYTWDISRQFGKDFGMGTLGVSACLKRRRQTRIVYAAPTREMLKELIMPTMLDIFSDCPPALLPEEIAKGTFGRSADALTWPWGARIVFVGVDLHPDRLRGPATYGVLFTECAFTPNLVDLMDGVIMPQLLTIPEAWVVMASTPPVTPAHPWTTKYIPEAKARGMYAKKVITDNPRLSPQQVEAAIKTLGGRDSTRVRRELFCEHITESSAVVVSEFSEANIIPDDYPTPEYRDCFTTLDPGIVHAAGACFGFFDFAKDRLIIEGDFAAKGKNTRALSHMLRAREWQLWGIVPEKPESMTDKAWETELAMIRSYFYKGIEPPTKPVLSLRSGALRPAPFARYSDTAAQLIADLSVEHGLVFSAAAKDDMEAAVNAYRLRIQEGRILFKRRAVNAINHTQNGLWNKARTRFAENSDGHFDCLPAMIYLNRMMPWGRNPNPPISYSNRTHHIVSRPAPQSSTTTALKNIFGRRRGR